jgi:Protein of unknown function (DUF3052)
LAGRDGERDYSHRSLVDKLGIKPGMRVAFAGVRDDDLQRDVAARGAEITDDATAGVVLLGVDSASDLDERIAAAWRRVQPTGAVWVVYPKGVRSVTENDVLGAGRAAGLLDVKVVSFSPTHTALRFVAPRAKR